MRQRINPARPHTGLIRLPQNPPGRSHARAAPPAPDAEYFGRFSALLYRMTYFTKCHATIRFERGSPRHVQPATETIVQKMQLNAVSAPTLRADEDAYFGHSPLIQIADIWVRRYAFGLRAT